MFLNNCLKVVGAAVTYFYGVFIEDFVVAVFLWEMLADQVQKFSSPSPRSTSQSATETPTSLCIAANPFYLTTRPPGQRKTKTTCST